MKKIKKNSERLLTYKWPVILLLSMTGLAFSGYLFILFGGKYVVDQSSFIFQTTTVLETEDGEEVGRLYRENRMLVPIKEIPEHVKGSFIAIEDNRFYEHAGVDFKSIMRAVYRDMVAFEKVEGGSTITQQLAKNVFLTHDKTWLRKTKEVMAAIYLERNLSKDKILEYYLNEIYFGHGVYGVEAASQFYFSKSVNQLDIAEGAMLAALPKAPNNYSPINNPDKTLERRNLVLARMHELGMLDAEAAFRYMGKTLGLKKGEVEPTLWKAAYIDLVLQEIESRYHISQQELYRGGYRIVLAMNQESQKIAFNAFQKDDYFEGSLPGVEGSFVLMDSQTGAIKAAIGGRHFESGDLNRLNVKRQPGSVMKPLAVYGPALELEAYSSYSLLQDKQLDYGDYIPVNYDHKYMGEVSLYQALVESKNAPAVWLLDQIGISYAKEMLAKLGLKLPDNGLAIALGGLEEGVTPIELVKAYRSFSSGGSTIEPYTIEAIYHNDLLIGEKQIKTNTVFNAQTAWDMTRMLEAVVQDGTGQAGNYNKALAGKTGSTQHPLVEGGIKDAWFVGYTPEYVGSVWIGYDHSDREHYLTKGSQNSTELMKDILTKIDRKQELQRSFEKPVSVKELPKPVVMPGMISVQTEINVRPFTGIVAELKWNDAGDDRIIYRIYEKKQDNSILLGEVTGQTRFTVNGVKLFQKRHFYVIPVNPLTGKVGKPSNVSKLNWEW